MAYSYNLLSITPTLTCKIYSLNNTALQIFNVTTSHIVRATKGVTNKVTLFMVVHMNECEKDTPRYWLISQQTYNFQKLYFHWTQLIARITFWTPRGHTTNRGRPRTRWRDDLDSFLKHWRRVAQNVVQCRSLVKAYAQRRKFSG